MTYEQLPNVVLHMRPKSGRHCMWTPYVADMDAAGGLYG